MKIEINSNKFKAILVEKGIKRKELAAEMNITPETLSRKISNEISFSLADAVFISKILNMSIENIFQIKKVKATGK
jgi:transcriptional regulator with XRE-family HTH domain